MATYTDNYNLKKPTYAEPANVKDINDNMEIIDDVMHSTQISLADAYDINSTYNTGDIVMYEMLMYKCKEDNVTGAWNASKWERTTAGESGGNHVDVDEKYQTGLNVADIDVDGDQHSIKVPYMTGATSLADGAGGLVPAPEAGDEGKFLKGDGTWEEVISGETIYGEASGAVASFSDGSANPLVELKVAISPIQASGTPTPQAPIPIYGWTGAEIHIVGKNLFNIDSEDIKNGYYDLNGNYVSTTSFRNLAFDCKEGMKITRSGDTWGGIVTYWNGDTFVSAENRASNVTFIIPNGANKFILAYPTASTQLMVEIGDTAHPYVPYNPQSITITIAFGQEVYGGELDVKDEVIHPYKYYANYNGETLLGRWISSLDEYAVGATPTIGAQVVDFGAFDSDITITPTTISSHNGVNNIWADTGDIINCKYIRDLNSTINLLWNAVFNQSNTRSLSMMKSVKSEDTDTKEVEEEIKEEEPTEEEPKEEKR